MKKKLLCTICVLLFISVFAFIALAGMSSQSYRIPTFVLSGGGTATSSATFRMDSTLGQPSPLMNSGNPPSSDNYGLFPGFWYTLDFILPGKITVRMSIPKGWSMISLPVKNSDAAVSTLFSGAEVIYGYDKVAGYVRVQSSEEIMVGNGYWILLEEAHTYTFTGDSIKGYTMQVQNGWYMIGGCTYPALSSVNNGNIVVIYSYIPGLGYQRLSESEKLETSKGYWILLKDIIGQNQLRVETENPYCI